MQPGDYIQTTKTIRRFGMKTIPKGTCGEVVSLRDGGGFIFFHKKDDHAWVLPSEVSIICKGETASG